MADKTRLRRKDLKRPDEFISLTARGVSWAREHQQIVTWGGAALIGLLAIAGIATAYRGARDRDANADLARAMEKLATNNYPAASTELIEVSGRWDGTGIAPVAGMLGANAAIRAGNPDTAITELARLEPQIGEWPAYLRQQFFVARGAAFEVKQQWLEAAAQYNKAASMLGPYTAEATLAEARTRELAGETDKARDLYRHVYEQFPDYPDRDVLAAKL